ncbi:phosphinothricin acetyltransferase [Maribacter spongiicola]|uniref:Phosphinothricin acetyltransferase n=1 Tax=Maribacter spongiicola TaxID=1206753 RepID=A0A4V6Q2R7_9FLAO|nr:GNAT family N-acetyltransferase [Maribacter spongiicola]TDT46663.1 phosphinothricin acetyltransferase [Maribacter spongiicola]
MNAITIRTMLPTDWEFVANIYKEGIDTGMATFETKVPTYEAWDKAHMSTCRFVAESNTEIMGWVALSPVSNRCVYGGVAEISVYISKKSRGKGLGRSLLEHVISASEQEGIWTLQSGIFPTNYSSIKVHEATGFRMIGKRERVGKLHGKWIDNVLFEKRSSVVGID